MASMRRSASAPTMTCNVFASDHHQDLTSARRGFVAAAIERHDV
jgi:hypothetical protein